MPRTAIAMSLYDRDNPDHEAIRTARMRRWTPEKEAAFQAKMQAKEKRNAN